MGKSYRYGDPFASLASLLHKARWQAKKAAWQVFKPAKETEKGFWTVEAQEKIEKWTQV